jgi:hypothetical protein
MQTQTVRQHDVRQTDGYDGHLAQLDKDRTQEHVAEPEGKNGNDQGLSREALAREPSFGNPQQAPTSAASSTPTTDPMALLSSISTPRQMGPLPLPSLANVTLISFLIVLAYAGASFVSLIVASTGVYYLWADWQRREAYRRRDPEEDREKVKGKIPPALAMAEESTEWLQVLILTLGCTRKADGWCDD